MKGRIDKRTWGVLGKQQTYYSPQQFLAGKTKIPLNANPFDSWDVKRSRFNRIDGYENSVQQGGVVPQSTGPVPTPTPSSTPQPTPSITPTNTPTPSSTPLPAFDSDAAAYLASVLGNGGTADSTISAATNTLFTGLKSNNLYNKIIAFYPIVGGVSGSHKLNANGNATYDLTYNGGWTHDISGQTPSVNGYSLLNYVIPSGSASGATQNFSFGAYMNTNTDTYSQYEIDMGVRNQNGAGNGNWRLVAGWAANNTSYAYNGSSSNESSFTPRGGAGFYIGTRTGTTGKLYFNGTLKDTDSPTTNESSDHSIALGAEYNGSSGSFNSSKRECFAFIAQYLDDTEISNLSSLVNTFQTSLTRNSY